MRVVWVQAPSKCNGDAGSLNWMPVEVVRRHKDKRAISTTHRRKRWGTRSMVEKPVR